MRYHTIPNYSIMNPTNMKAAMQNNLLPDDARVKRENRVTAYLSFGFLPFILGLYIALGYLEGLIYWSAWFIITTFAAMFTRRLLSTPLSLVRYCIFSYLTLTMMGLLLVLVYRSLYAADFAPWADDSYYFMIIKNVAGGHEAPSASLYEYIMAVWYRTVELTKHEPVLLDLLPMNWATGSMLVVLSYALCYEVTKIRCSLFLITLTLLGNCVLVDTVVNLYRDGMVVLFSLIVMLAVVRKRHIMAIVGTCLAAGVRGANGMLMALFVLFAWASRSKLISRNWLLTTIIFAMIGSGALFLDYTFKLGDRLRSITRTHSSLVEETTIAERAMSRSQWLDIQGGYDEGDLTKAIVNKIPGGFAAMPVLTMFSPFRFSHFWLDNIRCTHITSQGVRRVRQVSGIYPTSLFRWITVLSWIVLAPYLLLGLAAAFSATDDSRRFLVLFLVALFAISYVSFQVRHRLIFIVLFPIFVALGSKAKYRWPTAFVAVRIVTAVGITVVNIASWLL